MRAEPRLIKDIPLGFDKQDVYMAYQASLWNRSRVSAFLAPSHENEAKIYQIGIAFVGKHNASPGSGHAEIVIRDGNGLCELGPPLHLDLTAAPSGVDSGELIRAGPSKLIATGNIRIRVLHLRNAKDGGDSLRLALEQRSKLQHYRYIDLYRIRTTERRLRHLSLLSCPEEYNTLVDDCATFCQTFLNKLLGHLLDLGKNNGGIDRDQYKYQKHLLEQQIHIEGGVLGQVEWRAASSSRNGHNGTPHSKGLFY